MRIAPFFVTEHLDCVVAVAIDRDDQLLLVDQYRHAWGITSRELPAGVFDPVDNNPTAARRRELLEETGLGGGEWRVIGSIAPNRANQSSRCHIVYASGVERIAAPQVDPTERLRLVTMPVPSTIALARDGGVLQAVHVAALSLALGDR